MNAISLIIPTYNRSRLLASTLESVKQIDVPREVAVELLVINNNCTDDTAEIVEQAGKNSPFPIRHVIETRQGLCFGRNRGISEAAYDHLGYLDDDIEISPDWIAAYFEAIEMYDADCVVGPVFPKFEETPPEYVTDRIMQSIDSYYSRKGDEIQIQPPESASQVPGCNFGVRKSVAMEVGGFNANLDRVGNQLLAGGDTEFGMRLGQANKRIVYHPKCLIQHVLTFDKVSKEYLRRRWAGLGATQRALASNRRSISSYNLWRYRLGAVKSYLTSWVYYARRQEGLALQYELQARRSWNFAKPSKITLEPIANE